MMWKLTIAFFHFLKFEKPVWMLYESFLFVNDFETVFTETIFLKLFVSLVQGGRGDPLPSVYSAIIAYSVANYSKWQSIQALSPCSTTVCGTQ